MSRLSRVWILVCAGVLAITTGCVTRGKYNALEEERNALEQEVDVLTLESDLLANAAEALGAELAFRDREIAQLEKEQAELEDELTTWLVAGAIKMQLLKDGLHVTLSQDILFAPGSTQLSDSGRELIGKIVEEFEQIPYQIAVLGYTDNVPIGPGLAERYPSNWELAAARAAAVVRLMQEKGISAGQMVAVSFGETRPIASNDTADDRAQNRRIELRLRPIIP